MRSWLGVAAAAILLTGGGAVLADGAASASPARTASASRSASAASPSPAAWAARLASQLVAEMRFPAGTKPATLASIPAALRDGGPPGSHWAHAERLLVAPVKPAAVWAVLLAHKPFDEPGSMGAAASNGPVGSSTLLEAPESGVSAAIAAVWVEPWHNGGTLIAAYGFATWLPVRTAAEHLNPGSFRAVTVTASSIVPRQGTQRRTFTSAVDISRITAFLNKLPAAPQLALPCPMPATSYQVTFAPKVTSGPKVTVSSSGCLTDQITVNGKAQPLVWDTSGGLAALLGGLLHGGR
jgi:hypothetical protein